MSETIIDYFNKNGLSFKRYKGEVGIEVETECKPLIKSLSSRIGRHIRTGLLEISASSMYPMGHSPEVVNSMKV